MHILRNMKERADRYFWVKLLLTAVTAAAVLGLVFLIFYYGQSKSGIWLPASSNNDEVYYNRQVTGVLKYGQPKGYFGYNESHAPVGHFGAWGAPLIYLYAIPGLLVGIGQNTMLWCNILFVIAGVSVFICGARLSWSRQLVFAAAAIFLWIPIQQTFTGTAEPIQYFFVLAAVGAAAALQRKPGFFWFLFLIVICTLTTITRAYTALLWMLPVTVLWQKRRPWAIVSAVLAVISLALYLVCTKLFCALLFGGVSGINLTAVNLLLQLDVTGAVAYEISHVSEQAAELWNSYVWPTLTGNPQVGGAVTITMAILVVVTILCIVYDRMHRRPVLFKVLGVVFTFISLLAMMSFYIIGQIWRHGTLLNVLLLAILVYEDFRMSVIYLPLLGLLIPLNFNVDEIPTYRADVDEQIQVVQEALSEDVAQCTSDDPWDYTVAYVDVYRGGVFHGYMYAVPAGMGIQYDLDEYITDPDNEIYSRYVMADHGGAVEARLLTDGWQELVSTDALVVYERPDSAQ